MGLMTTITHWWSSRETDHELTSLDADGLGALARDVGLCPDQLSRLVARGSSRGEELPRLMRAVGLAPERIGRMHPDVMRDMSIVCSGCEAARRCRRDLDQGRAPMVQGYCPNMETFKALQAERCHAIS
jgi:hypothetical protein